jgi:hypothetical protein
MSPYLSENEIAHLTRARWRKRQIEALNAIGAVYKQLPDNSLLVSREHIRQLLGESTGRKVEAAPAEPDFEAAANA